MSMNKTCPISNFGSVVASAPMSDFGKYQNLAKCRSFCCGAATADCWQNANQRRPRERQRLLEVLHATPDEHDQFLQRVATCAGNPVRRGRGEWDGVIWGARASRGLVAGSRRNELFFGTHKFSLPSSARRKILLKKTLFRKSAMARRHRQHARRVRSPIRIDHRAIVNSRSSSSFSALSKFMMHFRKFSHCCFPITSLPSA